METTARLGLPLITPGQAQKEVFHNEALARVDALLHAAVEAVGTTAPPSSPTTGQAWIVGVGAGGAWAGQGDSLAFWTGGGWRFASPPDGMTVWDKSAGRLTYWSGTAWREDGWPVAALRIGGDQVVGPRQPDVPSPSGGSLIDVEARAAIAGIIATLKAHGLIE